MKNKNITIELLVIVTLLGYIATSVTVFIHVDTSCKTFTNEALSTILQGLTAFIGGFVAFAFGVSDKTTHIEKKDNKSNIKITSLGSFATRSTDTKKQTTYGAIFITSYLIFGLTSIVLWVIFNDKTLESVKEMATTFFAILIPIVSAFLYKKE